MQTSQEQAYKRTETQWSETAEHLKCSSNVVLDQNALNVKRFTVAKDTKVISTSQHRPSVLFGFKRFKTSTFAAQLRNGFETLQVLMLAPQDEERPSIGMALTMEVQSQAISMTKKSKQFQTKL